MSDVQNVLTDLYQIPQVKPKANSGASKRCEIVHEEARMRAGVKAYVETQQAAGKEVCEILVNYVAALGKHS